MWQYEKALQYPVKIKNPNPALARCIITQFGGPDGELGAANRYLSQRYAMPYGEVRGILTDVGTDGAKTDPSKPMRRRISAISRCFLPSFFPWR